MKHLRVVLSWKILLAFSTSFLLWIGLLLPVQAHSTVPRGACTLAIHGVSLTITVEGPNAELLCQLALQDPKITKAAAPLGGLYETHKKPHGHIWCKRSFSGFTVIIRSVASAIGKAACKSFTSA
jgi:hypothetical protein